jgi:hypothetical protein
VYPKFAYIFIYISSSPLFSFSHRNVLIRYWLATPHTKRERKRIWKKFRRKKKADIERTSSILESSLTVFNSRINYFYIRFPDLVQLLLCMFTETIVQLQYKWKVYLKINPNMFLPEGHHQEVLSYSCCVPEVKIYIAISKQYVVKIHPA